MICDWVESMGIQVIIARIFFRRFIIKVIKGQKTGTKANVMMFYLDIYEKLSQYYLKLKGLSIGSQIHIPRPS